MMERFLFACAILASIAANAAPARADEGAFVESGRVRGRVILMFSDPWACAIAVIRPRCQSDLARTAGVDTPAIVGLKSFLKDGNRDGYDKALASANAIAASPRTWAADPLEATLFDIGALQVSISAARDTSASGLLFAVAPAIDIRKHADTATGGALNAAVSDFVKQPGPGTPTNVPAVAKTLYDASIGTYPFPSLDVPKYPAGPAGYARYGLVAAWISEFIDNPPWFQQPDVQSMTAGWIAQSTALTSTASAAAKEFADTMRVRPLVRETAQQQAAMLTTAVLQDGPQVRGREFLGGAFSAQLAYNAAVLRDSQFAGQMLRTLGGISDLDDAFPEFARLRATADSIKPDDWPAQFKLGNALTAAILVAPSARASTGGNTLARTQPRG